MQLNTRPSKFKGIIEWAASISGAIGLIFLFVPTGVPKDFLKKYPLLGWAAFLALITIGPSLNHIHTSRIREQVGSDKVPPVDSAFALATAELKADERLLIERLHGWGVGSHMHEVICGQMSHYKISIHFVETIEECMSKWQKDARRFNDPAVQNSWDCFREDAEYYVSTLDQVTFLDDSGRFLDVPREWKTNASARYIESFNRLQTSLEDLSDSLKGLHQVHHELLTMISDKT